MPNGTVVKMMRNKNKNNRRLAYTTITQPRKIYHESNPNMVGFDDDNNNNNNNNNDNNNNNNGSTTTTTIILDQN